MMSASRLCGKVTLNLCFDLALLTSSGLVIDFEEIYLEQRLGQA
jgi:hypothetical protein